MGSPLADLRALLDAATPRPWARGGNVITDERDVVSMRSPGHMRGGVARVGAGVHSDADAALIVAAVNMLPALLDCADALDAIVNADPHTDGYAELEAAHVALDRLQWEQV